MNSWLNNWLVICSGALIRLEIKQVNLYEWFIESLTHVIWITEKNESWKNISAALIYLKIIQMTPYEWIIDSHDLNHEKIVWEHWFV